jgi:hypothetical protein
LGILAFDGIFGSGYFISQVCSLAVCAKDGTPRISVTDYINEGLTIYIFSEGGDKFKNLKENRRFSHGMKFFRPVLEKQAEEVCRNMDFPKGMVRMIRITPTKMVYFHNNRGIANAHWSAE